MVLTTTPVLIAVALALLAYLFIKWLEVSNSNATRNLNTFGSTHNFLSTSFKNIETNFNIFYYVEFVYITWVLCNLSKVYIM